MSSLRSRDVRRPKRFFLAFLEFSRRFLNSAALAFSDVSQARQHAEQDVEREINWRLMEHPFGYALEKGSAHSEKDADSDAAHRVSGARPEKRCAQEQPSHPQKR